jgi:hypothetical protein
MMHAAQQDDRRSQAAPDAGFRQTVLLASKRFKSSWVDLGKLLVRVRDQALFDTWGFPSFETYCLSELHIRKQTALKLTRSFSFLDKHEPEKMRSEAVGETAPAFEVVEMLASAEERGQLNAQEYKSIRDSIWNGERPTSELRRELSDKFPPPAPAPEGQSASVKRLWALAKKLAAELHATKAVPRAVAERADALADDLADLSSRKSDA